MNSEGESSGNFGWQKHVRLLPLALTGFATGYSAIFASVDANLPRNTPFPGALPPLSVSITPVIVVVHIITGRIALKVRIGFVSEL
ncbi:MAG: hypothetical protein FWG25_00040 [Promicromonosporaceae bacterium]|nr:hypothetical protein [Promicromonosporaceae bacterium]